jgi:hypothetical protein
LGDREKPRRRRGFLILASLPISLHSGQKLAKVPGAEFEAALAISPDKPAFGNANTAIGTFAFVMSPAPLPANVICTVPPYPMTNKPTTAGIIRAAFPARPTPVSDDVLWVWAPCGIFTG